MPTPYRGMQFTFTQPDGTELKVRGWGNQHQAVFETLDGFTVVQNPDSGFYEYAQISPDEQALVPSGARAVAAGSMELGVKPGVRLSAAARSAGRGSGGLPRGGTRWEQRLAERKQAVQAAAISGVAFAPPQNPSTGKYIGLCLLIDFPDVRGTITPEQVEAFCNRQGYSDFANHGSVRDYFLDISGERLDYRNVVTPYYTAKHPRSYYTDEMVAQPTRARELILEALRHWKKQGFDFAQLTADAQGYVYATNVFYAGRRVNNWAKGLWPHCFHLATPYALGGGKQAYDYQITDMTDELSLGTFCHENGHMVCNFPDLYDYGSDSSGVGAFCLMCSGANADWKNPTHVGAYLKYRAGWAGSVQPITTGLKASLNAGKNEFFIHRKSGTEYFIIENRNALQRDKALPDSGLAIWHVDELGDNQNQQMTPQSHYECSLVQADAKFDLERNVNEGDAGDLFDTGSSFGPSTAPASKWWDGSSSRLEIHSITVAGPVVQFEARLV